MPVMDGFTATKKIRAQARFKELPIIAMTANVMTGDREKVVAVGMNDHIGKPLNFKDMFAIMAKWISPSQEIQDKKQQKPMQVDTFSRSDFEHLQGIDLQKGLTTAQSNFKLYYKLLTKFNAKYCDFEDSFNQARHSEDKSEAERLCHTLKGVAASIGAMPVSQLAEQLESACRTQKHDDYDELLEQIVIELEPLLSSIDQLVVKPTQSTQSKQAEMSASEIEEQLSKLRELLESNDVEAQGIVDELLPLFEGHKVHQSLKAIERAVQAYDFEQSLETLEQLSLEVE